MVVTDDAGLVTERPVEQLYDPEAKTFLADRFVRGACPHCRSPDQYGDSAELPRLIHAERIDQSCAAYSQAPCRSCARHRTSSSNSKNSTASSKNGRSLENTCSRRFPNYLRGHFLGDELRDWDVTRPPQYFGFEVPDFPGHSWYVWFDAPIGYIASTWEWCKQNGGLLDTWWRNPDTEIHHFIGKDITYFHTFSGPGF